MTDPAPNDFVFVPLNENHSVNAFVCEEHDVAHHLAHDARTANENGLITTLVAAPSETASTILGFVSFRIAERQDHRNLKKNKKLRSLNVPCVFINAMGVDARHRRRGIGTALLFEVYRRCAVIADEVACFGVMLQSVETEPAKRFYEASNMSEVSATSLQGLMFIRVDTIRSLFESSTNSENS